jgi:isopentenyl-diphosphate Delta-isomerase
MNPDFVVLVDELNQEIGVMEKHKAHEQGKLHRALSVFIFNDQNELLLQRRAFGKYHSEGLWSNTCCTHPMQGEEILTAAKRRLKEEMGMKCELKELFKFTYQAHLDNNLTEHEIDHDQFRVQLNYYLNEPDR